MAGVINKKGQMVVGPKAEMEATMLKEMNKAKKSYKNKSASYKSMGGKMSKYYSAGGTVFTGRD